MSKESILTLESITKSYIQGKFNIKVLQDINLNVVQSELIAVIGSSGSGKSTLLHIIGLLDKPDSGKVKYNFDVNNNNIIRLNHLGFIYQDCNLLKDFTAVENIMLPRIIAKQDLSCAFNDAKVLISKLGLSKKINNLPGELSGGEQQKVAIARSIINNPKLLLADEPTGNLDPNSGEEVFKLFIKLARDHNTSILMVTHNYKLAMRMDKIYRITQNSLIRVK